MWIICAYYTKNTSYAEHSKILIESLVKYDLPHDITAIDNKGNWYANMQYKPMFLKQMMEKHSPLSVIYVDVDAIFCRYPEYFDKLENEPDVNVAVHILDHRKYKRKSHPPELLSGTIFLKNTAISKQIVDEWIQECSRDPKMWDQRALATVLRKHKYHLLPEEYCMIFDYMQNVKNPVIKHFQASRESRRRITIKKRGPVAREPAPRKVILKTGSRRVVRNGVVQIRRSKK